MKGYKGESVNKSSDRYWRECALVRLLNYNLTRERLVQHLVLGVPGVSAWIGFGWCVTGVG